MKRRAVVKATRTSPTGQRLLHIVCPICDHRHWLPDTDTGTCTRKPGILIITRGQRK